MLRFTHAGNLSVAGILAVILVVAAFPVRPAAADGGATFSSDTRIARVGVPFPLAAEGLTDCATQDVEVGLVDQALGVGQFGFAHVDDAGRTVAFLAIDREMVGARAAVRGDCVDGGTLLSDMPIPVIAPVHPVTTPTPTPLPGSETATFVWGEGPAEYGTVILGDQVTLSVSGLERCSGQEIELGFFAGLWGRDIYARTRVSETGQAAVTLTPTEITGDQRAGAIGNCLQHGFVIYWGRQFYVQQPLPDDEPGYTPTPVTPQPPVVGWGLARHGDQTAWPWVLFAGLAGFGAAAAAITAWLRR